MYLIEVFQLDCNFRKLVNASPRSLYPSSRAARVNLRATAILVNFRNLLIGSHVGKCTRNVFTSAILICPSNLKFLVSACDSTCENNLSRPGVAQVPRKFPFVSVNLREKVYVGLYQFCEHVKKLSCA